MRIDSSTSHDFVGFDLGDIGEIAADRDFQIEVHIRGTIIDDVDVLVHASIDRSADHERQGAHRDGAAARQKIAVGQEDAGGIVGNGAAIQQHPWLAVGIDGPSTDDARVEEIDSLLAGRDDLAILLRDQHRLALVNGDLRRPNLDSERHGSVSR